MQDNPYRIKFRFRWDDIDANRHVANSSYLKATVDQRMALLRTEGFDQAYFGKHQIGPVVLNEELYYLSEVTADEEFTMILELEGLSSDKRFFRFAHKIYGDEGEIVFYTNTTIALFDLKARKLIEPPKPFMDMLEDMPRSENYGKIKKSELRKKHVPFGDRLD